VIGRIVRPVDFERVLRMRSRVSSVHFALHHLPDAPARRVRAPLAAVSQELSTGDAPVVTKAVDDSPALGVWLGAVVPKRHARRSVTRSLIKRQIRAVVARHAVGMAGGLWVVRLRSPFDRTAFPSAASEQLKAAARVELEQLFVANAERRAAR
jgi:ribonuclease P protein component